jgi:hypothetical protein
VFPLGEIEMHQLRILFYLEWKHSDAIFNGFDLFSKPCVKRKSHLDEKEWVIKPCHLWKVVVLNLLENSHES